MFIVFDKITNSFYGVFVSIDGIMLWIVQNGLNKKDVEIFKIYEKNRIMMNKMINAVKSSRNQITETKV